VSYGDHKTFGYRSCVCEIYFFSKNIDRMPEPYRYYYSLFQGLFTAQSLVRKYAIVVEFSLFKVKIEYSFSGLREFEKIKGTITYLLIELFTLNSDEKMLIASFVRLRV
jgi:hypothetical protein